MPDYNHCLVIILIFTSLWFNTRWNYVIISLLMWSVLACLHIGVLMLGFNIWIIYGLAFIDDFPF